eukprot:223151_1
MKSVASLLFLTQQSALASLWDYSHMTYWPDLYSMCNEDDESPIDIDSAHAIYDSSVCTSAFNWTIDHTKQTFKVTNNGHALGLTPVEPTDLDPDMDLTGTLQDAEGAQYTTLTTNENTIAKLPNYFLPEGSPHEEFCLHSLHFHWGTTDYDGSEHFVDGHQYALEAHFVHYSCSHGTLDTTLGQFPTQESVHEQIDAGEDTHQLAVVGIFFDVVEGESNAAFDAIFENMDEFLYPTTASSVATIVNMDLMDLLPDDLLTAGYYAYEGSLTTPPCTDIVRWHVMNARGWIGSEQIEHFRDLLSGVGHGIAPNYRTVQDNVNDVFGCFEQTEEEIAAVVDDSATRAVVWVVAVVSILMAVSLGVICVYKSNQEKRLLSENTKTVQH